MKIKSVFVPFFCGLLSCAAAENFSSKAYNDDSGARIFFGGAPFAKGARFTVHSPGWRDRYVRNTRHAVAAGLLTDLVGVIAAIGIAYLFFY